MEGSTSGRVRHGSATPAHAIRAAIRQSTARQGYAQHDPEGQASTAALSRESGFSRLAWLTRKPGMKMRFAMFVAYKSECEAFVDRTDSGAYRAMQITSQQTLHERDCFR
jgi:hypothetical protein